MARKFKYLPSVHKGYAEQGMIFLRARTMHGRLRRCKVK